MAVAEITIIPSGTGSPSASTHVAKALRILREEEDLKYQMTPMGTIVEGDLDRILLLAKRMHEVTFDESVRRVMTLLKIDDRRDKPLSMEGKLSSLMAKLDRLP
jgi:uncharacterized protein (TIGR00106 family)